MRVLRSSAFVTPGAPTTTVVRDCDTEDTLEGAREYLNRQQPEIYIHHDLYEVPGEITVTQATLGAMQRSKPEEEQDCALMFYWVKGSLARVKDGGILMSDIPAPLSAEQMVYVHSRIKHTAHYRDQHIIAFDRDKRRVELLNGKHLIDGEEV